MGSGVRRSAATTALVGAITLLSAACGSSGGGKQAASSTVASRRPTTTPEPASTTTRTSSTTVAATSTTQTEDQLRCIDALPARVKAGQMLMAGLQSWELASAPSEFARLGLGGAIFMTVPAPLSRDRVDRLAHAGSIPLLIATDEEGGIVQRLARVAGVVPSAHTVATTMTPAGAQAMIEEHARKVAALGFNVVFAPVVDVQPVRGGGPIGNRSFGSDPATVTAYGNAYVRGWQAAGIMPVLKHFPGHGSASGDTHNGAAVVPPLATLRTRDLLPFAALAHTGNRLGVMVAHVEVPGFTTGPASLSPAAYGLLRNEIGFNGLVFTDALGMGAIARGHSLGASAVTALAAGADVALFINDADAPAVLDDVTRAIGNAIPTARADDAVRHVLFDKGVDPCAIKA